MPIGRRGFPRDKGARELVCKSQSAAPSMQVGSWIACRVCCWFGAYGQCFNGLHHECPVAKKWGDRVLTVLFHVDWMVGQCDVVVLVTF